MNFYILYGLFAHPIYLHYFFNLTENKCSNVFLLIWLHFLSSDLPFEEPCTSCKETEFRDVSYSKSDIFSNDIDEIYDPVAYETKTLDKSTSPYGFLIPPFKEWREIEMAKHGMSLTF